MKLSGILLLFPMLAMAAQWAFVDDFMSNPLCQSQVPQFILDSKHPWVLENKNQLERLPDAGLFLCSSTGALLGDTSESRVDGLEVPADLFDYLQIGDCHSCKGSYSWVHVQNRLKEIQRCPAALERVKTIETKTNIDKGERTPESRPPAELVELFGDVLGNMTSLETLKWWAAPYHAHYFEDHFVERGLVLPSVSKLELSPLSHFLIRMCPNVTDVRPIWVYNQWYSDGHLHREANPTTQLMRAGAHAPKLHHLSIYTEWTPVFIQEIVTAMPGLRSLDLRGEIAYRGKRSEPGSSLKDTLQTLTSLENLTSLELPHAGDLDIGWDGGHICGNAYFGASGRRYLRRVVREGAEAIDKAAAMIMETLPRIESFRVGDYQANVTRHDDGTNHTSSPWTGRMDEWVMEEVPITEEDNEDEPEWLTIMDLDELDDFE